MLIRSRSLFHTRRPPLAAFTGSEPSYNAATDKLILTDSFDSYNAIATENGSPAFVSRYSDFRVLDLNNNYFGAVGSLAGPENAGVLTLITGRNGTGKAIRIKYGNPTPNLPATPTTADYQRGVSDCIVGPSGKLGSIGAWDGTLPEQAGPYTHFLFTTWIRFSAGADPAVSSTPGVKGVMHWHTVQRYEHAPHQIGNECGGLWYNETHWDCAVHPPNSVTGFSLWQTADGRPPLFADYADGNWHRYTVEYYIVGDSSGHFGVRWWLDGVKVLDDVDQNWNWNSFCQSQWVQYPIIHWMVFGNFANAADSWANPAFTVDFDDWIAWTN